MEGGVHKRFRAQPTAHAFSFVSLVLKTGDGMSFRGLYPLTNLPFAPQEVELNGLPDRRCWKFFTNVR